MHLKNLAFALLRFLECSSFTLQAAALTPLPDGHLDGGVEDLLNARHLLGTALHVFGAHLACDGLALLRSDGCEALSFEELDTRALVPKIGLQAAEDNWGCRAEVKNLRVPL